MKKIRLLTLFLACASLAQAQIFTAGQTTGGLVTRTLSATAALCVQTSYYTPYRLDVDNDGVEDLQFQSAFTPLTQGYQMDWSVKVINPLVGIPIDAGYAAEYLFDDVVNANLITWVGQSAGTTLMGTYKVGQTSGALGNWDLNTSTEHYLPFRVQHSSGTLYGWVAIAGPGVTTSCAQMYIRSVATTLPTPAFADVSLAGASLTSTYDISPDGTNCPTSTQVAYRLDLDRDGVKDLRFYSSFQPASTAYLITTRVQILNNQLKLMLDNNNLARFESGEAYSPTNSTWSTDTAYIFGQHNPSQYTYTGNFNPYEQPHDTYIAFKFNTLTATGFSHGWIRLNLAASTTGCNAIIVKDYAWYNPTVAVIATTTDPSVRIFPNPISNHFSITSDNAIHTIKITDICGRTILESSNQTEIDAAAWATGLYFIEINSAVGKTIGKIVKE